MDNNYGEIIPEVNGLLSRYGASLTTLGMQEPSTTVDFDNMRHTLYGVSPRVKVEIEFTNSVGTFSFFQLLSDFEKDHKMRKAIKEGNEELREAWEQLELLMKLHGA